MELSPDAKLGLFAKLLRIVAMIRDNTHDAAVWRAMALYAGAVADDLEKN